MFKICVVFDFHGSVKSSSAEQFDAYSIDDTGLQNKFLSISTICYGISGLGSIFSVGKCELIDFFWKLIWKSLQF